MYIKDDICYAGEITDDIKIIEVKPLEGQMLLVTFSTGERKLYDTTKLTGRAFDVLKDKKVFENPVIFHGVITWKDGEVDIAPETVYYDSYPYETEI